MKSLFASVSSSLALGAALWAAEAPAQQPGNSLLPIPAVSYPYPTSAMPAGYFDDPQVGPAAPMPAPPAPNNSLHGPLPQPTPGYDNGIAPNGNFGSVETGPNYGAPYAAAPGASCAPGYGAGAFDQGSLAYDGGDGSGCMLGSSAAAWNDAGVVGGARGNGNWFVQAGGLIMNRDRNDNQNLSYLTANPYQSVLGTNSASMDWSGGFQIGFGRYFNCGRNAIQGLYWGVFPRDQRAYAYDPNGVGRDATDIASLLDFGNQSLNGAPINNLYDNAIAHRLDRSYQFHNAEVNLLGGSLCQGIGSYGTCCAPGSMCGLRLSWLAGFRFFRFQESFNFATSYNDTFFDYAPGGDDAFYRVRISNNLFGGQIGGNAQWCLTERFGLYAGTRMGVFGNRMHMNTLLGDPYAAAFVNGMPYYFNVKETDVSLLGELDVGARYQISCRWSAFAGWRTIGVSGIGLATNQIPRNFNDVYSAGNIAGNGSLILTGAYAGAAYNF